jgi:cellulose biosynthesis protein BcsQ
MKLACVDNTASERMKLQRFIDEAYEQCRNAIGHVPLARSYPVSKEELLLSSAPDIIIIGPGFTPDESYNVSRDIKEAFQDVPLFVFVEKEAYHLRTLRRFQKVATEIFSQDEAAIRFIHRISSTNPLTRQSKAGKLISVIGAKGGVGTTTVVGALAHAAAESEKSVVVLDLSSAGVFIRYMASQKWQSTDFATSILEGLIPDVTIVQRWLTTAANGVTMLLPPSGGQDIREKWLRDESRFEITLAAIDILRDLFDLIIVDTAGSEGILTFALNSRADTRLLITSNDPASVHLVNHELTKLSDLPGFGKTLILMNMLSDCGLYRDDILDFLFTNKNFQEEMANIPALPFDRKGSNWIGTGNTFYTESSSKVQTILREIFYGLMPDNSKEFSENTQKQLSGRFENLKRICASMLKAFTRKKLEKSESAKTEALPLPESKVDKVIMIPEELLRPSIVAKNNTLEMKSVEEMNEQPLFEMPKIVSK